MGAAGAALVALQPQGATELAGGAAVWMAVVRLPVKLGVSIGAAIAIASVTAAAIAGSAPVALLAAALLLAMLGLVGYFMKQSRASQDRTELLLAQLEDAREEQTRAAAIAERSRIAGELHDVLAHSLSAAAIQLQAARKLAERDHAAPPMRAAIDRAGDLVKDGLANARQAVGALRGETLPGVAQIELLVTNFRDDLKADVKLSVEGDVRTIPSDAGLALYRGTQEALTNVARYAPGATVEVVLRYDKDHATLTVEDHVSPGSSRALPTAWRVSAAAVGSPGCASASNGLVAAYRPGRSRQGGVSRSSSRHDLTVDPRAHRRRSAGRARRVDNASRPHRRS